MSTFFIDGPVGGNPLLKKAGTTTDGEGAEFPLGTKATASDGACYMYVQAGAAIAQYDAVGIDEAYQAAPITSAMALDGYMVGIAQVAFSDNDFGWVAVGKDAGNAIKLNTLADCAADVPLYTSGTAGKLDDSGTVAGVTGIEGVVLVSAATDTVTSRGAMLSFPKSRIF